MTTYLDKLPVGSIADCKHCDKPLTLIGTHKELGPTWVHNHRTVWCEMGVDAKNKHSSEPKF